MVGSADTGEDYRGPATIFGPRWGREGGINYLEWELIWFSRFFIGWDTAVEEDWKAVVFEATNVRPTWVESAEVKVVQGKDGPAIRICYRLKPGVKRRFDKRSWRDRYIWERSETVPDGDLRGGESAHPKV